MVSIKLQGGLANQLFQTAFIVSYAEKHGLQYVIPETVINPHVAGKKAYRFDSVKYTSQKLFAKIVREKSFSFYHYDQYEQTCFEGYFQSWKYFDEKRMQELFNLPWIENDDTCAIHVRRGDYMKWPDHHPAITKEYILLSMDFMNSFFGIDKFKFFSDDLPWCKANFFNQLGSYEISYSHEWDELKELSLLSCHNYLIGSNSAFSLWGHYLNRSEDKFAIFPEKWFGPLLPHDTKDLYPLKSIQI